MRTSRLVFVFVFAAAVAVVLSACTGPSGSSGSTSGTGGGASTGGALPANLVTLQGKAFNPASLTVKSGDVVTFRNADSVPHDIVVGTDDLGQQQTGEDKTWTAPKDGVYLLKCLIHPSMQGQITVGAGGATIGTPPSTGGTGGGGGSTGGGTGGGSKGSGGGSGGYGY